MKQAWVNNCLELCKTPADFYSGSRKIIQNLELQFPFECDLTLADAGYTSMKMRQLERNYLWQESVDSAVDLWNRYRQRPKYRSVSFSCYGHFVKDHHGPRGSVMGPCMQSVVLTMDNKGKTAEITVLYRTTEIFKKFPADLVFLKERLLSGFDFSEMTMAPIRCYYVNATIHPAYFVILIPHLEDPIEELRWLRKVDPYFWEWVVKWTARYTIEKYSHGIAKFSQALQVKKYAVNRITGEKLIELQRYLEENHPGYKHTSYSDEGEEDVD